MMGDVSIPQWIDSAALAARPMSKAFAQHALVGAGNMLVQQGAQNVSGDPLSTSETQLQASAVEVQRIADDLAAVNDGGDPVAPELADEVQSSVSLALGLKRTIDQQVSAAAQSIWHKLGLPVDVAPNFDLPSPFGISWTTVALLAIGGYALTRRA